MGSSRAWGHIDIEYSRVGLLLKMMCWTVFISLPDLLFNFILLCAQEDDLYGLYQWASLCVTSHWVGPMDDTGKALDNRSALKSGFYSPGHCISRLQIGSSCNPYWSLSSFQVALSWVQGVPPLLLTPWCLLYSLLVSIKSVHIFVKCPFIAFSHYPHLNVLLVSWQNLDLYNN